MKQLHNCFLQRVHAPFCLHVVWLLSLCFLTVFLGAAHFGFVEDAAPFPVGHGRPSADVEHHASPVKCLNLPRA